MIWITVWIQKVIRIFPIHLLLHTLGEVYTLQVPLFWVVIYTTQWEYFATSSVNHRYMENKHSDACIYLPPYKLDVLKIVEYKFSCEMEAHVEVTTSLMFDCNTFKDKRHLLTLVLITLPSKQLQFCNFIMQ